MTENRNKLEQKDSYRPQPDSFFPANAEEQKQLDAWFDSLKDNGSVTPFENDAEKAALKQRVIEGVFDRIGDREQKNSAAPIRTLNWNWLKVAASVAIVSTLGLIGYNYWNKPKPVEYVAVSANNGRVMQVMLPDSTTIWLQAGSTLKYPKQFSDTTREVYLDEGLAYFKVTHNKEKPFIVHTPQLDTRVLGTSFVIKSYKQLDDVQVDLLTGRVRVSHNKETLGELTPNKRLTFHRASAKVDIEELNTAESARFVRGDIVLQRAGFEELFTTLQNIYGVKFKYDADRLKDCKFNLRFKTSLKVEQVLEIVNGIHPIKFNRNGKEITIETKGCNK
ncbi:FecR family protein [Solitalea lacus]|uniref:FecR family protein n=1 Tax=Solitalea lacus TaxID=2911172 RepID=UPI001EDA9DFD|nr:FecR family protein [Solitalea lacus]UKJ07650.1 FecR family protein [Solitalea lacus]